MSNNVGTYDIIVTTEGVSDKNDHPEVIVHVGRTETWVIVGTHHLAIRPEDWAAVVAYSATRSAKFALENAVANGR